MRKTTKSIIATFIIAISLLSLFTAKKAFPDTFGIIREGIGRDLQGITRKQAEVITAWVDARKKDIRVTANNLPVYRSSVIRENLEPDFSKPLEYLAFLKNIYHYKEVFVVNPSGTVIVSTDKNNIGKDVSSAQYFQEAIKGKTFFSDIMPSTVPIENEFGELELGLPTMFVSTQVTNEKMDVLGALVFRLDVNELIKLIIPMKATETGEVYLINKDGYMLTSSRYTSDLKGDGLIKKRTTLELKVANPKTGNLTQAVQQCLKGIEGYNDTGYLDYRGTSVIGYWMWMPYLNWGLVAEIDIDEACNEVRKFFQDTTIKNLRGLMHRQVELLKMRMEGHKNNAAAIARKPQTIHFAKGVASVDEFVNALNYLEFIRDEYGYKGIFICDSAGVVRLSTEKNLVNMNFSGEDYFLETKKHGVFVSDVKPSTTPILNEFGKVERNVPTLFVSAVIKNNDGAFAGVVVFRVDTMELNKLMQSMEIGESGETYLIDSEGVLITESRFVIELKRKEMIKTRTALELKGISPKSGRLTKGISECLSGSEGYDVTGYPDYRGVPVIGTWCWIPEYEWGIIVEIDLDEAFRKSSAFWGIKQYF
ncbi:MAG: cache domain-containing protein [Candidatus Brocadiaceae bacterium]|uniref:cache domain-containing protein n=1 Tax=Candidatus Wunengus sp. YC61 TaxID=3367698 RepID=UPI0027200CB7|nr:cache domain-containing protein [Candidatus Brocadiaceae bacterium]